MICFCIVMDDFSLIQIMLAESYGIPTNILRQPSVLDIIVTCYKLSVARNEGLEELEWIIFSISIKDYNNWEWRAHDVVANGLNCDITVSSNSHLLYYVNFQTNTLREGMNPLSPNYGLNDITMVLIQGWHEIPHKGWHTVKQRNQTKPNQTRPWMLICH